MIGKGGETLRSMEVSSTATIKIDQTSKESGTRVERHVLGTVKNGKLTFHFTVNQSLHLNSKEMGYSMVRITGSEQAGRTSRRERFFDYI